MTDIQERIERLSEYRDYLDRLFHCVDNREQQEQRRLINLRRAAAEREIIEAGQMKLMTVEPPPAIGGLMKKSAHPFTMLFDAPYSKYHAINSGLRGATQP